MKNYIFILIVWFMAFSDSLKAQESWVFPEETKSYQSIEIFKEGFAVVMFNGKYGFLNKQGKEQVPCKYDLVHPFSEGMAAVQRSGRWGFVDTLGNEVISCKYYATQTFFKENCVAVKLTQEDDGWYYIDKNGKTILPLQNQPLYKYAFPFNEKVALVTNSNGMWSFIDRQGNVKFQEKGSAYDKATIIKEGLIRVLKNDKYGFVDVNGNIVISTQYDNARTFSEGLAAVFDAKTKKWGFITNKGQIVKSFEFEATGDFINGFAIVRQENKFAFINKKSAQITPFKYDYCKAFSEGLAAVKVGNEWGFIDQEGNEVILPSFNNVNDFSEGLAAVEVNGKWGYIDRIGKYVLLPKYMLANSFSEGHAMVWRKQGYGALKNPITLIQKNTPPTQEAAVKPILSVSVKEEPKPIPSVSIKEEPKPTSVQPLQLSWIKPFEDNELTKHLTFELEVCLNGNVTSDKIKLLVNGQEHKIKGFRNAGGTCPNMLSESIFISDTTTTTIKIAYLNNNGQWDILGEKTLTYDRRLALVIGVGDYNHNMYDLANPTKDSRRMADSLKQVGFEVMYYENLTKSKMQSVIDSFGTALINNKITVALFYYAGHALEVNGKNYLIPIDANPQMAAQVDQHCVLASNALAQMSHEEYKANLGIYILDACRDNPYNNRPGRSLKNTLQKMEPLPNTIVAFATAAGSTATDNDSYTTELLKHLTTPGLTIETIIKRANAAIKKKSNGQQVPSIQSSFDDEFILKKK